MGRECVSSKVQRQDECVTPSSHKVTKCVVFSSSSEILPEVRRYRTIFSEAEIGWATSRSCRNTRIAMSQSPGINIPNPVSFGESLDDHVTGSIMDDRTSQLDLSDAMLRISFVTHNEYVTSHGRSLRMNNEGINRICTLGDPDSLEEK